MIQARSQLEELRGALHRGLRKACERLFQSYESVKATEAALEGSLTEQEKAALELDRIAIPYHALEHETQANCRGLSENPHRPEAVGCEPRPDLPQ